MHNEWTDKLSEYIDGELSAADAAALQRHLLACDECAAIHAELLQIVSAARNVEDAGPAHDLWAGIAGRIGAPALPTTAEVVPITAARRAAPRRFAFSLPQLAAAAAVLMALSGGFVYMLSNRAATQQVAAGTIVQSSGGATSDRHLVSTPSVASPMYDSDVAELEQLLQEQRTRLDPQTVEVIERSLESIDHAIEESRTALSADPGNPYLHRQLDNTMQKKLDILRRATRVNRAGS
jgi:anti-sigma factor RsiW